MSNGGMFEFQGYLLTQEHLVLVGEANETLFHRRVSKAVKLKGVLTLAGGTAVRSEVSANNIGSCRCSLPYEDKFVLHLTSP